MTRPDTITHYSYHVCQAQSGCTILTNKRACINGFPRWYLCVFHMTTAECDRLMKEETVND